MKDYLIYWSNRYNGSRWENGLEELINKDSSLVESAVSSLCFVGMQEDLLISASLLGKQLDPSSKSPDIEKCRKKTHQSHCAGRPGITYGAGYGTGRRHYSEHVNTLENAWSKCRQPGHPRAVAYLMVEILQATACSNNECKATAQTLWILRNIIM